MRYRDFLSHVLIEPEFYMILKEEGLPMARRADGSYWDKEADAAWENWKNRVEPFLPDPNPDDPNPAAYWKTKVQCRQCEDIIYSSYSGEYVTCKCGAISVDQTPCYSRFIGNQKDFKVLGNGA